MKLKRVLMVLTALAVGAAILVLAPAEGQQKRGQVQPSNKVQVQPGAAAQPQAQLSPQELRAKLAKLDQMTAAAARKAEQEIARHKAAFEKEQQTLFRRETAKAEAEMKKLSRRAVQVQAADQRVLNIQKEAVDLHKRFQTASPQEQAAINRRAKELLNELRRLGVVR